MQNVNMGNRGGVQRGPGKTELRRYIEKGMTQAEIAEAWEKDSGVRVSRSTIAMATERYGLHSAHPRPRYEDMLPWTVTSEHRMSWDARMLRLEGRNREGGKLAEDELRWLTQWREDLEASNAVITYHPGTLEGFHPVERHEDDTDLIRRPKD